MSTRERIRSTHALILRRRDVNDADRVLTVLTPSDGKLELIAKGVRKTTSRKAGHLELFVHAALLVAQGRTWDIITEVQTVESFRHLRENLDAIAAASYVCELVDSFAESDDEVRPLWDLALFALRELDEAPNSHELPANLLRWFDLQLLSLTGFQPQFFRCLACEKPLEPTVNFLSLARRRRASVRNARRSAAMSSRSMWTRSRCCASFRASPGRRSAGAGARPPGMRRVESLLQPLSDRRSGTPGAFDACFCAAWLREDPSGQKL